MTACGEVPYNIEFLQKPFSPDKLALRVPEVIIPANAAVFSAWGMLQTDLRRDYVRTGTARLDQADPTRLAATIAELEDQARAEFADETENGGRVVLERGADMRYRGQEHTVKVALPDGRVDAAALDEWATRFRAVHDRLYRIRLEVPVEVVNFHLTAYGLIAKPALSRRPEGDADPDSALTGRRKVDFGEPGMHEAVVYDRTRLVPGMVLTGPAVTEERGAVVLVWPGQKARVDGFDNIVIRIGGGDGQG